MHLLPTEQLILGITCGPADPVALGLKNPRPGGDATWVVAAAVRAGPVPVDVLICFTTIRGTLFHSSCHATKIDAPSGVIAAVGKPFDRKA
jgi:hypothetical protein